ncbi:hypothetical protein GCM10010095_21680 [Streptomyces anthocyanicus]|uniref:hypothetical protein n=1 Tax=Streptomyces anthocyanicus TaxID=68174 RepID=UPI0016714108|nr:hypothetical protein [Streptomyces anthocyanicus]GGL36102.1 hypothetical protein GCM10010095_21680 [Streptomyces anthocyanicus]
MDAFYALAVLACPVGMGAMMWFMMKGNRQHGGSQAPHDKNAGFAGFAKDPRQQEVDALRKEIADLRSKVDSHPETAAQKHTR